MINEYRLNILDQNVVDGCESKINKYEVKELKFITVNDTNQFNDHLKVLQLQIDIRRCPSISSLYQGSRLL